MGSVEAHRLDGLTDEQRDEMFVQSMAKHGITLPFRPTKIDTLTAPVRTHVTLHNDPEPLVEDDLDNIGPEQPFDLRGAMRPVMKQRTLAMPPVVEVEGLDDSVRDDVGPIFEHYEDIERDPMTMTSEESWSQHQWSATSNPVRWQLYDQSNGRCPPPPGPRP